VFKKVCTTCHSNEPGVNKTGPSLFGVYGRKAGSSDFPRYKGLVGADFTWDEALLDEYLQDPKAFVVAHTQNKTTAMTYSVKDPKQRADVIAYLQTLKK
jgi:cytochrome c